MTGVQTCALPICFPVTILSMWFPSHDSRDGADVKNTQAALAAIDQMKQQLSVMDTEL